MSNDPHETPTPLEVRHEDPIVAPHPPESHPDTPSAPLPGHAPTAAGRTGDTSPVDVPRTATSPKPGGDDRRVGTGSSAGRTGAEPALPAGADAAPEPELPAGTDPAGEPELPAGTDSSTDVAAAGSDGDADPTEGGPLTRTAQQLANEIAGIGGVASLAPGMKDLVASATARVLRRTGGEPMGIDLTESSDGYRVRIDAHFDDSRSVAAIVDEIFSVVDREVGEPVEVDLRVISRDDSH
ncbi:MULTISPECIES: hypothetical protein [Brevibacterium]|uniref:Uncharacterized protein n=2 Tax=Brevibacterium casei TaxID=33889 RepID=A0A2H1HN99_9MICO|nr:hypothetical protein [Brevibacterium casei]NJE67584.1 hypothetical protein [Brevibacterium sp. LS14]SIG85422.1 Uncharacterised protein [Mycobacteroides abscessus subsp. abscessus]KZE21645.1 hypothetical protein AVW13_09315 [Brevibacterium casei]MBE4694424.1 hypothetical protein [Brevibacterium casei]MBY3577546.1 hypothetical protein [Brevibacterium casei]